MDNSKYLKDAKFCFAAALVCFAFAYVVDVVGYQIESYKYFNSESGKRTSRLNQMATVFSAAQSYLTDHKDRGETVEAVSCDDLVNEGYLTENPEKKFGKIEIVLDEKTPYAVKYIHSGEEFYPSEYGRQEEETTEVKN